MIFFFWLWREDSFTKTEVHHMNADAQLTIGLKAQMHVSHYRPQLSPLALIEEHFWVKWSPLPCKPVLPLPGTGRLFVMLPWRGRLGDDATLAPHTEFPFPPVWLVVLTTIYSFIHTKNIQCRTGVSSDLRNILWVDVDVRRDCRLELGQQILKSCNEFMRPPDNHHQQASLFVSELVHSASPTTI